MASDVPRWDVVGQRRWVLARARRPIAEPLMWPVHVVIEGIGLYDMVELAKTEAEEVVQAFSFQAADP